MQRSLGDMPVNRILFALLGSVLLAHVLSYVYLSAIAHPQSMYPILQGDSETYVALADSLIENGGFAGSRFETERHWPPGYPAFLAALKLVTGSFTYAVVIQIALALVAVYFIYLMALRFLPSAWATVPALLYGLDPNVVLANTTVLSDSLFSSILVIAVYFAFFADIREWMRWGVVALLLSIATLIRPIAQFLVPLAPLMLSIALFLRGVTMRTYVAPLAVYVLVVIVILAPWLSWVHGRFGVYEISHVGASNLLHYNARDFLAWKEMNEERSVPAILASRYRDDPAYAKVDARIQEELVALTPESEESANYEGSLAARLILQDPLRYAYFHLVNTAPFFVGSSIAAYQQVVVQVRDGTGYFAPTALALLESAQALRAGDVSQLLKFGPVALEVLVWAFAFALALFAVWAKRADGRILAFAGLVAYFALLTGPVSIVRYRIPAEAFLLILAVIGVHVLNKRRLP